MYTLEELAYEYYIHSEIEITEKERAEAMSDKIEEDKVRGDEEWADEMEREEEATSSKPIPKVDNVEDAIGPDNIKWAEEEMQNYKDEYGDSFGENVDIDF